MAVPALIYGEGDPQVILVESRGQPLRWRKTVSAHALTTRRFGLSITSVPDVRVSLCVCFS